MLTPIDSGNWWPDENEVGYIGKVLQGLAVIAGDKVNIPLFGGKDRFFSVDGTSPSGAVIINQHTKFKVNKPDYTETADSRISYEDIGGLERELRSIREMVEIPLRYGEIFDRLGIEAPKGLLLYGPPGTGKTLIARAIAGETKLHLSKSTGRKLSRNITATARPDCVRSLKRRHAKRRASSSSMKLTPLPRSVPRLWGMWKRGWWRSFWPSWTARFPAVMFS